MRFQIFHSSGAIWARSSGVRTSTNTIPLTSSGCSPAKTRAIVALLKAADVPGPYVLVAHSLSGTTARVFAGEHPDEVKGIVFVDATSPEFRAQMAPEQWKTFKRIITPPAKDLAANPNVERPGLDKAHDQTAAAAALRPMPVVVLTASDKYVDVLPKGTQAGQLPPDTPPDFGVVMDRAWSATQNKLAP